MTLFSTDSEGGRWLLISGICDETAQIKTVLRHYEWKVVIATEVCPHDRKKPELSLNIVTITPESEGGDLDNGKKAPFNDWRFDQTFDWYPEGIGKGDFDTLNPLPIWSKLQTYRKKLPNDLYGQHGNGFIEVGILSVPIQKGSYKHTVCAAEMNQMVSDAPSIAYVFKLIATAISSYIDAEDDTSSSTINCDDFKARIIDDNGAVNVQRVINYIKENLNAVLDKAEKEQKKEILTTVLQRIFDAHVAEMGTVKKTAAKAPKAVVKAETTAVKASGTTLKAEAARVKREEETQRRKELRPANPDTSIKELVKQLTELFLRFRVL